jgi:5-methylcytosine-specific restriction enzyme A
MTKLSSLTDPIAVESAVSEYDRVGGENFLSKYGFKPARNYVLEVKGKHYDSKAIVGAAFGYQHGEPLAASDFSGGEKTVKQVLEKLGFKVALRSQLHPLQAFVPAKIYNRQRDIHARYGGQERGGISTPTRVAAIFLFTGSSGLQYGYQDQWTEDGVYLYTGEGQKGDMQFAGGNRAIRDHAEDGKDLLLFESLGKGEGYRYVGPFSCASWEARASRDVDGGERSTIVFHLIRCEEMSVLPPELVHPPSSNDLSELRRRAIAAAKPKAGKRQGAARSYRERSDAVRDYVLARANGKCECCLQDAPFTRSSGAPYLEPHHTHRLADDGPDDPRFVAGICPTCHRRIHHGADGHSVNLKVRQTILALEEALGSQG